MNFFKRSLFFTETLRHLFVAGPRFQVSKHGLHEDVGRGPQDLCGEAPPEGRGLPRVLVREGHLVQLLPEVSPASGGHWIAAILGEKEKQGLLWKIQSEN